MSRLLAYALRLDNRQAGISDGNPPRSANIDLQNITAGEEYCL